MPEILKDGMDSGDVPDAVKLQVFVNGIGICAAPDCLQRIVQDRTRLGECAHIIPRKVGSHPREDYTTPLEERKKEHNLLYLCERHHKIVDNKNHASLYPADLLRDWKKRHEAWAAGITKNSPYLPQDLRDVLAGVQKQIAEQANVSDLIIQQMIDSCRELLDRFLLNEARIFLSQIDLLLLKANNSQLNAKADLLNAILLIRNEQVPEAKQQLLQIIQANPHSVEAMLEYVELCANAPEPDDDANRIEELARALSNEHPRLRFIDLVRKYKRHEIVEIPDVSENWADDPRLNARFMCQYALCSDFAQKTVQRDAFVNRWETMLPNSPRPHLFRLIFKTVDFYRSPPQSSAEQSHLAQEFLQYSSQEKEKVSVKDPLGTRSQISWLIQELKLEFAFIDASGSAKNLADLRDLLISLVGQCYFDGFIDDILLESLGVLRIEPDQWTVVTQKILASSVPPSSMLVHFLFLHGLEYDELYDELGRFLDKRDSSNLSDILKAIRSGDAGKAAEYINSKQNPLFSLNLLQSISTREIAITLAELLEVSDDYRVNWLYARLKLFDLHGKTKECLETLRILPVDQAVPQVLFTIAGIANKYKQWDLFIPPALQLLTFDIPPFNKSQIHAELAVAYFEQRDDSNAIYHADQALLQGSELGEANSQTLLHVMGQSLKIKGQADKACEKFQQYAHIKRSFSLLLEEADLYSKSTFPDKYDRALALVLRAFEEADSYNDDLYLSAMMLLIDISGAGNIPNEEQPAVEDGLFVKLEGFPSGWFYIGDEEKSLGAETIRHGHASYSAVIHKAVLDDIAWPADKFSNPSRKRKILHIANAPAFLSHRAHEAMDHKAKLGNAPIWSVQVTTEDGSFDVGNLKLFFKEQFEHKNEFFEKYVSEPLPFAFLCAMEGSLPQALGKIATENKGFIRLNNSSAADIEAQQAAANDALQGTNCIIDGLCALMLAEARLLEPAISALPNLGVSTSVVRLLRNLAGELESSPSSIGRGHFVEGHFQFNPRNKESDAEFRNHLLASAELLDQLPHKAISKTYPVVVGDRDLDSILPDYFVDAFRVSQEKNAHILTDDALLVRSYELVGESPIPKHFSSLSLIRAMAEKELVSWDSYLKYFARLSYYRYHLLPITVDDMIRSIFPPAASGLVTSAPKNIRLLNLHLTLSPEYGVNDETASNILSLFFSKLILDGTVPAEIADEVFALTIVQGLAKRDKRLMGRVIFQVCQRNLQAKSWSSPSSQAKLESLNRHLVGFAQGFDPIVIDSPLLLRSNVPGNYDTDMSS